VWKATEGKPLGRLAATAAMATVVGALAYTWLPDGDYEPIRPGEKGTLSEGVAAIAAAPRGRPSLVSQERAAEAGRLVAPPGEKPAVTTTTSPQSRATTTVSRQDSTETTTRRTATTVAGTTTTGAPASTTTVPRTTTTSGG